MTKKIPNHNFFAKLENGKLLLCETEKDGTVKYLDWKEPINPDQSLIDAVNKELGTNFTIADFKSKRWAGGT